MFMLPLFNRTFWRFALGFDGILVLGLGMFLIIGYAEYSSQTQDETAQAPSGDIVKSGDNR